MGNENHSPRYSQKVEIFKHRDEVLDLVAIGVSYAQIRLKLGLDHMAKRTFRYDAAKLKASISSVAKRTPDVDENRRIGDDAIKAANAVLVQSRTVKPSSQTPPEAQPEREDAKSPDEEPWKPAKRKRWRKGVITLNLDAKDQNLDPSKWSSDL